MNKFVKKLLEYLGMSLAAFFNAFALHMLINPAHLIPGGVSGLSSIIYYLTDVPISILYFGINIPLLVCSVIFVKGDFTLKTIYATCFSSLALQILPEWLVFSDPNGILLASIGGGALVGVSMYVATLNGGSNGGTEIIAKIVHLKHSEIDLSQTIILCNVVILILGGVLLKEPMKLIYSMAMAYVASGTMEMFMRGFDRPLRFTVITKNPEELTKHITEAFGRGVTQMDMWKDSATLAEEKVLVVVVQFRQSARLKRILKNDGGNFVYVKEAEDIFSRPDFNRFYKV